METSHDAHPLIAHIRDRAPHEGRRFAQRAVDSGLAITQPDGTIRSIPVGAIPAVISSEEIAQRRVLAEHLLSATAKAARWRLAGPERAMTLAALSAIERRLVEATWSNSSELAVARVDFLVTERPHALEVNTTIPAMQGYSDMAAESWLATFAAGRSDQRALIAANGSNTLALLDALVSLHASLRGQELLSMGLLCRRQDAQLTELRYLERRFRQAGLDARIVHPDELTLRRGYLERDGQPLQLIYRHLFVSRLENEVAPAIEAALVARSRIGTLVLNRPTPHLEMKTTLAMLSLAMETPVLADAIGLDNAERDAIGRSVPWTRPFVAHGHDSSAMSLLAEVSAHPQAYVLKRSWSYGGNEVFVGRAHQSSDFRARVQATFPGVDRWRDLCERAVGDQRGGGFVVQRAVDLPRTEQLLCTPTNSQWAQVNTDYAAFASLGTRPPWSGVCRAAACDVVNIAGGGAVVPVIRREVADRLVAAQRQTR